MQWGLDDEGVNLPIGQTNELNERRLQNPGRRRVIWNSQERGMWVEVKRLHILQRGLPDGLIPRNENREYSHPSIQTVGLSRWTSLRITSMEESRAASSWRVIAFYSITHIYVLISSITYITSRDNSQIFHFAKKVERDMTTFRRWMGNGLHVENSSLHYPHNNHCHTFTEKATLEFLDMNDIQWEINSC